MGIGREPSPAGIYWQEAASPLLRLPEAAALLRCSVRQVWRYIKAGELEVRKFSTKSTRVTGESLRAFIQRGRDAEVRAAIIEAQPVTDGLLNKLACEVAERDGRDPARVLALLEQFGVKHLGDVPVERRAEFRDRLLRLSRT